MPVGLHSGRVWRNSNFSLFPSLVDIYAELLLTLIGRICIVKKLAISKLVYNTSVLKVPSNFAEKVNDICFKFIWNFKPDKVKRETIVLPVDKGGLNMVDFSIVDKSLKAAWVKRFYEADGSKWCSVLASVTAQYGGRFIFECNFDTCDLNLTSRVPRGRGGVLPYIRYIGMCRPKGYGF